MDVPNSRSVAGYRVGRRLDTARYLGHIELPTVVELVFIEQLPEAERAAALTEADEVASLSSGERVVVNHKVESRGDDGGRVDRYATDVGRTDKDAADASRNNRNGASALRLESPPELLQTWHDMAQTLAEHDAQAPESSLKPQGTSSWLERWRRKLPQTRRGRVILAAAVGVSLVVVTAALWPSPPRTATVSSEAGPNPDMTTESSLPNENTPDGPVPDKPGAVDDLVALASPKATPTVEPESDLGDVVLVKLPTKPGSGDESSQLAVLERTNDGWRVREIL